MTIRTVDSKGRVNLGERFANRTVIVDQKDATEVHITMARVIPEREAWLCANPKAKAVIAKGLQQAKEKRFAKKPPNLLADKALIDLISDEAE